MLATVFSLTTILVCVTLFILLKIINRYIEISPSSSSSPRVILLTGCDSGLGLSTLYKLLHVHQQFIIIAACYDEHGVHAVQEKVKAWQRDYASKHSGQQLPSQADVVQLDVTNESQVSTLYVRVLSRYPQGVWCLISNAGICDTFYVEFTPMRDYRRTMEVNYFGTVFLVKTFLPLIKKNKGRVIVTSSFVGKCSTVMMSAYSASKFALESFCDALRQEMFAFGVSVSLILPGSMRTPMHDRVFDNYHQRWQNAPAELRDEYGSSHQRAINMTLWIMRAFSLDPSNTAGDIVHAVIGRFPQTRYLSGPDSWVFAGIMPYLPTFLNDLIIRLVVLWPRAHLVQQEKKD